MDTDLKEVLNSILENMESEIEAAIPENKDYLESKLEEFYESANGAVEALTLFINSLDVIVEADNLDEEKEIKKL